MFEGQVKQDKCFSCDDTHLENSVCCANPVDNLVYTENKATVY